MNNKEPIAVDRAAVIYTLGIRPEDKVDTLERLFCAAVLCTNTEIISKILEKYNSWKKSIYPDVSVCSDCNGTGKYKHHGRFGPGKCKTCDGTGESTNPGAAREEKNENTDDTNISTEYNQ